MKKMFQATLFAGALLLVGCSNDQAEEPITEVEELAELKAELTVPDTAEVQEEVLFSTVVSQGEEAVTDAQEVVYEVWEEGKKDQGEMIDAEHTKEGIYEAKKSFEQDGLYNVQVHVTANSQHTMPVAQIIVGEPETSAPNDHHAHGTEGFSIYFKPEDELVANKEIEFVTNVENEHEPLAEAAVRFEIWDDSKEVAHAWVDTKEDGTGTYKGTHTFTEPGTYQVQVHVEKEANHLHEHEQYEVVVK